MQLVYNWHITEKCNYSCHYCFSKWRHFQEIWKDKYLVESLFNALSKSRLSRNFSEFDFVNKKVRINFAGGEPLVLGSHLKEIISSATTRYGFECSIITNGSLLEKNMEIVSMLSIVGISVDSFSVDTNNKIGRATDQNIILDYETLVKMVKDIRQINPDCIIKFNVVVNAFNWNEVIIPELQTLGPDKIKVFRQLPFGSHCGILDEQYINFSIINKDRIGNVWYEDNVDMTNSYLMIDPSGRFFQNGNPLEYHYSDAIYDTGLENALAQIIFNKRIFMQRYQNGAVYADK
jgi:radical S-adenosyl methionine domain-containing protein 2